ncbi:MAG: GTPase domain-containing protein [Betaproteobacteria bacterium]|nr:GTPase domain-containing protein [Betaproteobacteria bacterium]
MTTITLTLVSHTNAGKTTLARTLLGRDIGEVRDAPHVTEFAEEHVLVETADGHRLTLWDTPGFGDSVRLARRMRQSTSPLGWLLSQVWDRWSDRAFWMSQQALKHVKDGADVLLYLVNASEPEAGYLASEMQLLGWTGRPVLVLLNQLGAPREAAREADEVQRWRERLSPWPHVQGVLPLDAFARCWAHEAVLLDAVQQVLAGDAPRAEAMRALRAAWAGRCEAVFGEAVRELAASLARLALARVPVDEPAGFGERLRDWGTRLVQPRAGDPESAAGERLAQQLAAEVRGSTARLLTLHGLEDADGTGGSDGKRRSRGRSKDQRESGDDSAAVAQILDRVARQVQAHRRVPEGRAAVLGGALTGALAGLKADIATGGLTLGGGMLAGGLLGALGAAGVARGLNIVRGTGQGYVGFGEAAMASLTEAAVLRYLAVAHYGRGRGDWAEGEAPLHWPDTVQAAFAGRRDAFNRAWKGGKGVGERTPTPDDEARLAATLAPLLEALLRETLAQLHPQAMEATQAAHAALAGPAAQAMQAAPPAPARDNPPA